MASKENMDTWDTTELPTKFNKYKRLKEREEREREERQSALAKNKNAEECQLQQSPSFKERSVEFFGYQDFLSMI